MLCTRFIKNQTKQVVKKTNMKYFHPFKDQNDPT